MFAELLSQLCSVVKPTDPKVAIGLSFLARGRGSPLYDPAALLATLSALSGPDSSTAPTALKEPTTPTTAELQAMLDSAPSGIQVPVTKAALVISTDVSLRSAEGTADTDDRIMLILLCYFLARIARPDNVHSVTIALSARKKGSKDKKDATTPSDVVQFMRERIAFFGTEASAGLEPPTPSFASFGIRGVEVRVFQLQAQTTPSPAEKLDAAELVAQDKQIAELREANAAVLAVLEAARREAPIYFTGCGPIDVALGLFLAEHAHAGYTISFGSGVNGGDGEKLDMQTTHCGGLVLIKRAAFVDIGPSITRALVTPPGIVLLDDAKGAEASSSNTFKVAGSPVIISANGASADSQRATGLALRIFVSNCTSFLGPDALAGLVAQCTDTRSDLRGSDLRDLSIDDEDREGITAIADFKGLKGLKGLSAVQFPYSHSLALTMVTGLLAAHGAPIDHTTLAEYCSTCPAPRYLEALSAVPMPPSLAATVKANINGISTVAGLYKFIALGMDARLTAIMAEWISISQLPACSELKISGPVVSTATPIITPSGSLALAQPF